jgi:hypothetical protein
MGSTYTDNGGIEKIGLGEQAGAWGTTTNNNFDIIDRLINGVGTITLSSGGTSDLSTSDGSLSNGMFKVLVLAGSPDSGHVITIDPPNADKLYFVKNGTGEAITFNQGTGGTVGNSRAVSVAAGKGAIIFADGAGTGAAVTDLTALFVNSQAIDNAVIGGTTPAAITGTTITATTSILPDTSGGADIGSTSAEFGDIFIADNKKIHFGTDQDANIEFDEDGTGKLLVTGNVTFADGATDVDIASHDTSNGLKLGGTLVTATAAELNIMDGVTATKDELNIMDGVTATTAELNHTDGVTSNIQTQLNARLTSVSGTDPIVSSGGTTPAISLKNDFLQNSSSAISSSTATSFTASTYPTFISGRTVSSGGGDFTVTVGGQAHTLSMRDGDGGTFDVFATLLPAGATISGNQFTYVAVQLRPG